MILEYLLDVVSLYDAHFPELSEDEAIEIEREEEREPIVTVKAMDDFDKEFYASKGFVESDAGKDDSLRHMVLKEGVIGALAKKRREEERNNEVLAKKSSVEEWDNDDIWTRRRKQYEGILEAEGVLEKPRPGRPAEQEEQPEEILKNDMDVIQTIERPEEVMNQDMNVIQRTEPPEEVKSEGVVSISEDIPGPDGQKRMALPIRLRSEPRIYTDARQNAARVRKEALSRRSLASSQ